MDQDSTESETSATELSIGDTCTVDDASDGHIPSDKEVSDDELFAAFDRIVEDSDEYWEKLAGKKIREFESFHDKHPCIVTDKKRSFEVWVDGTGQFKGTAALRRVDIKTYINSLMEKEAKATDLCRMMRDRIETLENSLEDSNQSQDGKTCIAKIKETQRKYTSFGEIKYTKGIAEEQKC